MKKIKLVSLLVTVSMIFTAVPVLAAETATATPTASVVLVNGERVAFDAYNIHGNNYFKLRDLAFKLSNTAKQFEVGWDSGNNAISLTSGKVYTIVGGEMQGKGAGNQNANPTTSKILLNGKEVNLTAYNIAGNNYFKLRDIGEAFDFGVDWDGARNTVVIDSGKGYTQESGSGNTASTPAATNETSNSWRQWLADYEKWVDDYIVFLEKYRKNPSDLTLLADYAKMTVDIAKWAEKSDSIEDELTGASLLEYINEYLRILKKQNDAMTRLTQ